MREIKFRAWDKDKKSMIYQENGKEGIEFNFGGISPTVVVWDYQPRLVNGECIDDYQAYHPEDFELMQYTGLKDKNGKEIYEGDIVEFLDTVEGGVYRYEVEFKDGMFTFDGGNAIGDYDDPIEIIGNRYENGDLLK